MIDCVQGSSNQQVQTNERRKRERDFYLFEKEPQRKHQPIHSFVMS